MFIIFVEQVTTVRKLSNNYLMYKSSAHSMSIQANKQTVIIVNIYKEAMFAKVQLVHCTIDPNSRNGDEKQESGMDWFQVNLALWRMAVDRAGEAGSYEFPEMSCRILCAYTLVPSSGEMICDIYYNLKELLD